MDNRRTLKLSTLLLLAVIPALLTGCIDWLDLGGGGHGAGNRPSVDLPDARIAIVPPVAACVKDKLGVTHFGKFTMRMRGSSGYELFVYGDDSAGVPSEWLLPGDARIVGCP